MQIHHHDVERMTADDIISHLKQTIARAYAIAEVIENSSLFGGVTEDCEQQGVHLLGIRRELLSEGIAYADKHELYDNDCTMNKEAP